MFAEEWTILASLAGFTAVERAWLEIYDNHAYKGLYLKKTGVKRYGPTAMSILLGRNLIRYINVPSKHPNAAAHDVGYKDLSKYAGQTVVIAVKDPDLGFPEHAAKVLRYPQWIIFLMFYRAQLRALKLVEGPPSVSLKYRARHPKYSKQQTYKMVREGYIERSADTDPCEKCPRWDEVEDVSCEACDYREIDGETKRLPGSRTIYPSAAMQQLFWLVFSATRGYLKVDHKPWNAHPGIEGYGVTYGEPWAPKMNIVPMYMQLSTPCKRIANTFKSVEHFYAPRINRVVLMTAGGEDIGSVRAYIANDRKGKPFPWVEAVERKATQTVRGAMSTSTWTTIAEVCKKTGLHRTDVTRVFWGAGSEANPVGGLKPLKLKTKYRLRAETVIYKCVKNCVGSWYYLGPATTR